MRSRSSQNNIFHGFTSNSSYSENFIIFDRVWPEVDSWWAQKILILIQSSERVETNAIAKIIKFYFQRLFMGRKMESEWLRYWENRKKHINTLPKAITFDPTVGFPISLVLCKLNIQIFLRTPRLDQSESGKAFKYAFEFGSDKAKIADVSKGGRRPL